MRIYQRPRSEYWWITYSIGGRRFRESTGTTARRQAEALLAKRKVDLFEGRNFPEKKRTGLTMAALKEMWLEHAKHKRSLKNDKTRFEAIVEFFGANCLVNAMTKKDIEGFRDSLATKDTRRKRKMAPATVNRHLALLRAALRHVRDDYLHRDPMRGVKFLAERNQRERECTPEEYKQLLEHAPADLRLAIVLAYEAGLRRTEICSATREHVNMKRPEIHIPALSAKTDTPRTVPLNKKAFREIKAAPARLDGKLVGIDPDRLTLLFTDLCSELNIHGLHFHDLRGAAITRLARTGANLAELQKFSGHKSIQALMRYFKGGDQRLRQLVNAMEEDGEG